MTTEAETPDRVTWLKILVAWAAVFVISVVIVDRVLWPAAQWVIALLGW